MEKKNLQESLKWSNLTYLQICWAPFSTVSSDGEVAFASGLFLGDCPMKFYPIASPAVTVNKHILPKNLHCTKYAVRC